MTTNFSKLIYTIKFLFQNCDTGASLVVQWLKLHASSAGGAGSIPGRGAGIPHASQSKKQNRKQKQYCNKFKKDFKNGPYQKAFFQKKNCDRQCARIHQNLLSLSGKNAPPQVKLGLTMRYALASQLWLLWVPPWVEAARWTWVLEWGLGWDTEPLSQPRTDLLSEEEINFCF